MAEETPDTNETPEPAAVEPEVAAAEAAGADGTVADEAAEAAPAEPAAVGDAPAAATPAPAAAPAAPALTAEERRAAARARRGRRRAATPEERAEERRQKAAARSRRRRQEREKRRAAGAGGSRSGTPAKEHAPGNPQVRLGKVTSDKGDKTIVVRIDTSRRHRRYRKIVRSSMTLHAHDERNDANEGDLVRVIETRPMSRTKRWRLVEILE